MTRISPNEASIASICRPCVSKRESNRESSRSNLDSTPSNRESSRSNLDSTLSNRESSRSNRDSSRSNLELTPANRDSRSSNRDSIRSIRPSSVAVRRSACSNRRSTSSKRRSIRSNPSSVALRRSTSAESSSACSRSLMRLLQHTTVAPCFLEVADFRYHGTSMQSLASASAGMPSEAVIERALRFIMTKSPRRKALSRPRLRSTMTGSAAK